MFLTFMSFAIPFEAVSMIEESPQKAQVLYSQSDLKGWFERNFQRYANLFFLDKDEILNMISQISIEKLARLLEVMNQKSDQERIRLLKSIVDEEKMSIHVKNEEPESESKPLSNPAPKVLFFNHEILLRLMSDIFLTIPSQDRDKTLEFTEKLWVRFGEDAIRESFHKLVQTTNYVDLSIDQKMNAIKDNLEKTFA